MPHDITCRSWEQGDLSNLLSYLHHLDEETRSRFEPHPFSMATLEQLYHHSAYTGFILIENNSTYIIGYAIIKMGYFPHDLPRLNGYSFFPDDAATAMYAPSIAKGWQGKGLGKILWQTVENYLKAHDIKQVLLWGGVQNSNMAAVHYYKKLGFEPLGSFDMNGLLNTDMVKHLSQHNP